MALLKQLHAIGLYGVTLEDTAEHLILGQLRKFLLDKDRMLRLPKRARKK